jgi:hypothetical protein
VRALAEPVGIWTAVARRASPDGMEWLRAATEELWASPDAIRVHFPAAPDRIGRGALEDGWTLDDAARLLLLRALRGRVLGELDALYRAGGPAERRAILRALPYLPVGDRAVHLVQDALASGDPKLSAAALGPYANAYLHERPRRTVQGLS